MDFRYIEYREIIKCFDDIERKENWLSSESKFIFFLYENVWLVFKFSKAKWLISMKLRPIWLLCSSITFEVKYIYMKFGKFIAKFGKTNKGGNILFHDRWFNEFWYLYIYQFICRILFIC